ncbi:hypothetical protein [Burkholderia sp. F1]|uniref:hypothetical protein n=1 Tax=Burkholderia sp. F1 TaxID=3366817 RepID=UPI003D751BB5
MTTIKPSRLTVVIFCAIGGIIFLPGILALRLGQLDGIVSLLVGAPFVVVPLTRYRVSWDAETLVYHGLVGTRRVLFHDVKKFDICGSDAKSRFGPTFGLRIFTESSAKPVMTINVKPFSRQDLAQVVTRLNQAVG